MPVVDRTRSVVQDPVFLLVLLGVLLVLWMTGTIQRRVDLRVVGRADRRRLESMARRLGVNYLRSDSVDDLRKRLLSTVVRRSRR